MQKCFSSNIRLRFFSKELNEKYTVLTNNKCKQNKINQ